MKELYAEVRKKLLQGEDVDIETLTICDDQGKTLLHLACEKRDIEFVRLLVQKGVDINAKDNYGITPIFNAVSYGFSEIVEFLIQQDKVDPNIATNKHLTVLHVAAILNDYTIMMTLLNGKKGCVISRAEFDCCSKNECFEKRTMNPLERCVANECYVNLFILIGHLFKMRMEKTIEYCYFDLLISPMYFGCSSRLGGFCDVLFSQKIPYINSKIREISSRLEINNYEQESARIKDKKDFLMYKTALEEVQAVYDFSFYILLLLTGRRVFNMEYFNDLSSKLFKARSALNETECSSDLKFLCSHTLYYENYGNMLRDVIQNMQVLQARQQMVQEQPITPIIPKSELLVQQRGMQEQAALSRNLALQGALSMRSVAQQTASQQGSRLIPITWQSRPVVQQRSAVEQVFLSQNGVLSRRVFPIQNSTTQVVSSQQELRVATQPEPTIQQRGAAEQTVEPPKKRSARDLTQTYDVQSSAREAQKSDLPRQSQYILAEEQSQRQSTHPEICRGLYCSRSYQMVSAVYVKGNRKVRREERVFDSEAFSAKMEKKLRDVEIRRERDEKISQQHYFQ